MSTAEPKPARIPLWVALGVTTLVSMAWKVPALAQPPHGEHAWRDATGIGVARGFLHESWNLLQPRVAERLNGTGVAGMELPLVPWLSAALMHAIGESYFVARQPVWLSVIALAFAALALARRILEDETAARIAAAVVVLQPLVIVFSRKLMPEIPMLALLLAGAAWALDGLAGSIGKSLLAGVAFALAAVLKPTGVAIAVVVGAAFATQWALINGRARAGLLLRSALIVAIPLVSAAAWFLHARALDEATGFNPIKLQHDWLEWTHLIVERRDYLGTILGRIVHLYVLWPTVVWMVFGWRSARDVLRERPVLLVWMVASIAVVILFGSQNYQHTYYALPATIPFAFWVGAFAGRFSEWVTLPRRLLTLFLAVFAITALVRANPRMPALEFDADRLEAALRAVPEVDPAVVTDAHSPVISLVTLHRTGWGLPAESLTPARLAELRAQGARQVIESSFGGWLTEGARASLPPPVYVDDQVRIYSLGGPRE